jgi:Ca-activated chloride channel family protein
MKKLSLFAFIACIILSVSVRSNGVAIKNAQNSEYFKLVSSNVEVTVYDQIAIVVTTQEFLNNTGENTLIKYGFPLPEDASGTGLRWKLNGIWQSAIISPQPQDTTLPGGGGGNVNLQEYLGETPLFFDLQDTISMDSILTVELTYVQLLPYSFYQVDFVCPNDYQLIQSAILNEQQINFSLESQRLITNFELLSHTANNIYFTDSTAGFEYAEYETPAITDYHAIYELSPDDLGLFSYSTFITDTSFNCDTLGNGFFTFLVEPDPQSEVIDKVFTLIIDRSGSMSGEKIVQARDAATYIVNNLNEGDMFNIVDFATDVTSLFEDHVEFTPSSQSTALSYINGIYANNLTNISGAFSTAIPDFASNDTTLANIIVFFTDGMPTTGITSTEGILQHIADLISYNEVINLAIHTFGIGSSVNQSLLSQIASQNNGLCQFLGDDELEEVITQFYNMIRNPVLINSEISVDPPLLTEIYPDPLGNLYLGQQLIVVGRYATAGYVDVTFSGDAFGQPQSYQYGVDLADTTISTYMFLTKLWAKEKMKNMYIEYHTYDPDSPEADSIKNAIIDISMCYNVISPFTSYTGGGGPVGVEEEDEQLSSLDEIESFAYPNPFSRSTDIRFKVKGDVHEAATIRIYNSLGTIVRVLTVELNGEGEYSFSWDGRGDDGALLPGGQYFYTIHYASHVLIGRMIKL